MRSLPKPVSPELQSPPWSSPEWAARRQNDVVGLTLHVTRSPEGVDVEDFLQEVRCVLVQRSWSPKSRWDPKRLSWTSWACMVIRCFSMNYHKRRKIRQAFHVHTQDLEAAFNIAGSPLPALAEDAPWKIGPEVIAWSASGRGRKRPQLSFPL